MATNKRTYPNSNFAWYNDEDRLANRKLIEKYNAGIVVPSDNVSIAAKELEALIIDEKRLFSSGKAAKELAIEHFDRDKLYKSFESVFHSVSN